MRLRTVTLLVVLFGSLLAACGGGGGTSGGSNADPVGAAKLAVSYIEQKKWDSIGDAVCAAQASQIKDAFTGGAGSVPGLDVAKILDALTIKVENLVVNEVSRSGDTAVVSMKGTMKMTADKAKLKEVVKDILKAQGQANPPDAIVDPIVDQMATSIAKDQPLDQANVQVVNEGGKWKICSDITG